ncbi:hypothetical protein L6R50_19810 [Myxococcota bacterium]|nr:hypothetical protein [Myxococcota bacterium]
MCSETCACRRPAVTEALRAVRRQPARSAGRLRIDWPRLHAALGGRAEVVEAMAAKVSGRPGVNAGVVWRMLTRSLYASGDLPVLATREALQNGGADAVRAAIRSHQLRPGEGRFDVTWDPSRRALTWQDNGIGLSADEILSKFLVIGESGKRAAADSGEAAGGFGVAKAVILGCSSSFRFTLHTRDNLAIGNGPDAEVEVHEAPEFLRGFRLTVFDVAEEFDETWDPARGGYVSLDDRIRELLGANDLPGLTITYNGAPVRPLFSRRGGSKVASGGDWGEGTDATVKAYRRPPGDRRGAYYVRLNGLHQFKIGAYRGNLQADVVIDLHTRVRPGERGYPLNAARDALQDSARWTFDDLVREVEREDERTGRDLEDEVFDPESDDDGERDGALELASLTQEAFADPGFQAALADAAGGIADFYAEQARYASKTTPVASAAPPGTRAEPAEDGPTRPVVLPPGMAPVSAVAVEPDVDLPEDASVARIGELRGVLAQADAARARASGRADAAPGDGGILTLAVRDALDRAEREGHFDPADAAVVEAALDRAASAALEPGGGGLLQAAAVTRALPTLDALVPSGPRRPRNPFGKLAGLRISRKNYDRARARRFRQNYGRWVPYLTAWDATLRLICTEARIRRRFKPGFVLNDEVMGLTSASANGSVVVYIHPDRFDQVVKAHRERPLAIAAFLHGVAVHELTHADGRMGEGHSEGFVTSREDLGAATGHLIPAIGVLVARVLRLPVRESEEQKRIRALERQLAAAREAAARNRKLSAEVARLERALAKARADLAAALERASAQASRECGERCAPTGPVPASRRDAERIIHAAAGALRMRPPPGIDAAYIEAFVGRHRERLLGLVDAAMVGTGNAGPA